MTTETLVVHILGKDYQVACPSNKRNDLLQAASELDRRMRAIRQSGNVIGVERIAIMAALNLANEVLRSGASKEDRQRIESLNKRLDHVLG
ncbi:MAG: cell division protein ZapA [Cellvibrionaceae bacterium]|jgi:cell division protein ZapA